MFTKMAALGCVMLVGALAGCAMQEPADNDLGVAAIQFADIPVPDGLRLSTNRHQSHSYEVGGFRYGDFVYTGRTKPESAVNYMTDRMGTHGWELRDARVGLSSTELVFWRRPYEATCRVWQDSSATQMTVNVRTHIGDPDSGTATP